MTARNRTRAVEQALGNLVLILCVAFGARLAFAIDQSFRIPSAVLSTASFDQETGSIAAALATHKGFSDPFNKRDRTDGLARPRVSVPRRTRL